MDTNDKTSPWPRDRANISAAGGISAGTVMPRNEGNVETLPATSQKQKAQRHPSVFMPLGGFSN
jgi:hypothetical protein